MFSTRVLQGDGRVSASSLEALAEGALDGADQSVFKLMEERYVARRASRSTTNLDYDQWQKFLGNEHLTSALVFRIRHRCKTLDIEGPSLRSPSEEG